jgi:hypothetical protein
VITLLGTGQVQVFLLSAIILFRGLNGSGASVKYARI